MLRRGNDVVSERWFDGEQTQTRPKHTPLAGRFSTPQMDMTQPIVDGLHRCLKVTRVDQSEPNFALVCTQYYRRSIMQRLSSAEDFVHIRTTGPEHRAALAHETFENAHATLRLPIPTDNTVTLFPTMMTSVKEKKLQDDAKGPEEKASLDVWRFITAAFDYPTKIASRVHVMAGAAVDKVYVRHCRDESIRQKRSLPSTAGYRRRKVRLYRQSAAEWPARSTLL